MLEIVTVWLPIPVLYLVFCFKIILGIWYHTFYDFEVYWYLGGKIAGILVSPPPLLAGPDFSSWDALENEVNENKSGSICIITVC